MELSRLLLVLANVGMGILYAVAIVSLFLLEGGILTVIFSALFGTISFFSAIEIYFDKDKQKEEKK